MNQTTIDRFRTLHASGCFVIPNPWDVGSARYLAGLGFPALATTSSGFAWSNGCADNHLPLSAVLTRLEQIARAVDVPLNADFEGGFATDPEGVASNVKAAVATGIAGISIEDSTADAAHPLFDFELAVARVQATREALDAAGSKLVFTARSEGYLVGQPDLDATITRLCAFAEAGADCLYAPGLQRREDIAAVVRAVAPKPVNVLVGSNFTTVAELADLGVRRISVGGALARAAWGSFMQAAQEIAQQGSFEKLAQAASFAAINGLFLGDKR